jgi:hypothetical protein
MGGRERARRAYRIAQQLRYQQLYHAVMSSLEAVCKSEVPEVRCGRAAVAVQPQWGSVPFRWRCTLSGRML